MDCDLGLGSSELITEIGDQSWAEGPRQKGEEKPATELSVCSVAGLCRPCPWDWELFQGSCYLFSRTLGSWETSASSCKGLGAHLVIVNSVSEQVSESICPGHWTLDDRKLWDVEEMLSERASCRRKHNGPLGEEQRESS